MKLTVIVPVYNAADTLVRCLDSLSAQGMADDEMEVLCVDDGSDDDTLLLLQDYAASHPNFRTLRQAHAGVAAARNLGMQSAKGEAVTFCDADDYLILGGLAYVMREFWDDDVDVICHGSITVNSTRMRHWQDPCDVTGRVLYEGLGSDVYRRDPKYFMWNVIIRRSWLVEHRLTCRPLMMCEDACFMLELLMANPRTRDVSCNYYRYIVSPGQVTSQRDPELMKRCVEDYLVFLGLLHEHDLGEVIRRVQTSFYSRVLSARYDRNEYEALVTRWQKMGVRLNPHYILYVLSGWVHRRVIVPWVIPMLRR